MPSSFTLRAPSLGHSYVGKNAVGASTEGAVSSNWKVVAKSFTLTSPAFLASIDAHTKGDAVHAATLMASLWDDNSGSPGKVLCNGSFSGQDDVNQRPLLNIAFNATYRWAANPIGTYLTPATYWMIVLFGSLTTNGISIAYDSGTGSDKTVAANVTWTNDQWSWSAGSNDYSIRGSILT